MANCMPKIQKSTIAGLIVMTLIMFHATDGDTDVLKVKSQTVYVPAYAHVYSGNREIPTDLAITVSIRNTDSNEAITITAIDYFDSDGTLVNRYLEGTAVLNPMATTRYVVRESDRTGGSGSTFIVRWVSDKKVNAPLIESVMIGTKGGEGISFTSRGQVIAEK